MKRIVLRFFIHFCIIVNSCIIFAQGDLLVTPTRIIFEGKKVNQDITLLNVGTDTATYNVSFIQNRASDSGKFVRISVPDSGQYFADDYIRFFPRRFTLAPNEPQTLRMQVRRRADMPVGELRSHLYFRGEPENIKDPDLFSSVSNAGTNREMKINLIPIYGISIPVLIRNGDTEVSVSINDLELIRKPGAKPVLQFVFNRQGNISAHGNILVEYIHPDKPRKPIAILEVNRISVFTPNTFRFFSYELVVPEGVDINEGKLRLRFISTSPINPETYAEADLIL